MKLHLSILTAVALASTSLSAYAMGEKTPKDAPHKQTLTTKKAPVHNEAAHAQAPKMDFKFDIAVTDKASKRLEQENMGIEALFSYEGFANDLGKAHAHPDHIVSLSDKAERFFFPKGSGTGLVQGRYVTAERLKWVKTPRVSAVVHSIKANDPEHSNNILKCEVFKGQGDVADLSYVHEHAGVHILCDLMDDLPAAPKSDNGSMHKNTNGAVPEPAGH